MDEPRDWAAGLPDDFMAELASRLPCRTDRRKMAAVCRAWRARAQAPPLPPALPWLLIPDAGWTRVHCFLSDYHVHHGIDDAPPNGGRYFGSHDGAWLFLAYSQTNHHVVLNLRDDGIRILPNLVERDGEVVRNMVILAAALSDPPDVPLCVGACIIARWPPHAPVLRRFAFWCMGSPTAIDSVPEPEPGWPTPANLEVEDVVFHGVDFHFLTRGEHIFVYRPVIEEDGLLTLDPLLNLFEPGGRNYDGGLFVHARYLVPRGPELLMVVRFANPQLRTSSFRVFRMIAPEQGDEEEEDDHDAEEDDEGQGNDQAEEEDDDQNAEKIEDQGYEVDDQGAEEGDMVEEVEYPWIWDELETLGGWILFVGRGCSRSYAVAQYPGLRAGIYFLDDRSFYDEEMMFRGADARQYPCNDNGMWSQGPAPNIQLFFPEQGPSNRSPPAWLLPCQLDAKEVPRDLVIQIISQVICDTDRVRALRAWRLKLPDIGARAIRPQLPWLLASSGGTAIWCLTCGNRSSSARHPAGAPLDVCGARYYGSLEGRWVLFFVPKTGQHMMGNLLTGERHQLPGRISFHQGGSYAQIILAATFSAPPDTNNTCIGAGIVRYLHPSSNPVMTTQFGKKGKGITQIALWSFGDVIAIDPLSGPRTQVYPDADDIVFYKGSLHCISQDDQLLVWTPTFSDGEVVLRDSEQWRHFFVEYRLDGGRPLKHDEKFCSRYLVVSRGQLLLLLRHYSCADELSGTTQKFSLFAMEVPEFDISRHGAISCICTQQPRLDGRMLFVGRGCSRSYETADYPGFKDGVYFSDDRSFYDDQIMFRGVDERRYPCSDNGKWTEGPPPRVVRFLPEQGPSSHSSPAWVLP